MRLAEMMGRHTTEAGLLAIIAGEPAPAHVSSCAACQARLAELRAWVDGTAADAAAIADDIFTPERLAAQKQQVIARLEAAGRQARVIAFPLGAPAPVRRVTQEVIRWTAAAAVAGILVGLVSGRLLYPETAATPQSAVNTPAAPRAAAPDAVVAQPIASAGDLDEAALLDAAYERVSPASLKAIDDMTPRAREIALARIPRARRR